MSTDVRSPMPPDIAEAGRVFTLGLLYPFYGMAIAKEVVGEIDDEDALGFFAYFSTFGTPDVRIHVHGVGILYDLDGRPLAGTVNSFDFEDTAGNVYFTATFTAVAADAFYDALRIDSTGSASGRYQYLVSLFDDNTVVTGNSDGDGIDVGAGNDDVTGNGGDDFVLKWKSGALSFNGGEGSDTVAFRAAYGPYPGTPVAGAVVNLGAHTGTNPYDGTSALAFTDVENLIGTELADTLTGSDAPNIFGDGLYDIGADTINGLAGNDWVNLAEGAFANAGGIHANGGPGIDTLAISMGIWGVDGPHSHRLDLSNQAKNTGVFFNDVLTNFEVFLPGNAMPGCGYYDPAGHTFTFIDSNDNAIRTVWALAQTNSLTMKGGNDTVVLLNSSIPVNYRVTANAGAGSDTLRFEVKFGTPAPANVLDLVHPANNSGIFANSTFVGFEVFRHVEADGGSTPTQKFTFRSNAGVQNVGGAYGIDNISTGLGNDILNGGLGNDVLNGGAGRDRFVFNTAVKPAANVDKINGYSVADDTIALDNAIFLGIGGNGALAAGRFHIGAHAHDANDRIIYNAATGALLWDQNGNLPGLEVRFATLAKHLPLTAAEFTVI